MNQIDFYTRRHWLQKAGAGFGGLGLASLLADEGLLGTSDPLAPKIAHFPGKAKSVIWLFINGGPSQVDTWDYKPELEKMVACAQRIADAEAMPLIETAGVKLSETLDAELLRLRQLNKRNQSIRPAEIEYFAKQKTSALAHLKNASANLQAVRIIINT